MVDTAAYVYHERSCQDCRFWQQAVCMNKDCRWFTLPKQGEEGVNCQQCEVWPS
jgi:hypothetical protein